MPLAFDDAIFTLDQAGGTALFVVDLQADNYLGCATGWQIQHDGDAEFSHLQLRGGGLGAIDFCNSANIRPPNVEGAFVRLRTADDRNGIYVQQFAGFGFAVVESAHQTYLRTNNAGVVDSQLLLQASGINELSSPSDTGIDFTFADHYVVGIAGNSGTIGHNYGGDVPIALKSSGDAYSTVGHKTPLMLTGTYNAVTDAGFPFEATFAFGTTFPSAPRVFLSKATTAPHDINQGAVTTTQFTVRSQSASTTVVGAWLALWNI